MAEQQLHLLIERNLHQIGLDPLGERRLAGADGRGAAKGEVVVEPCRGRKC